MWCVWLYMVYKGRGAGYKEEGNDLYLTLHFLVWWQWLLFLVFAWRIVYWLHAVTWSLCRGFLGRLGSCLWKKHSDNTLRCLISHEAEVGCTVQLRRCVPGCDICAVHLNVLLRWSVQYLWSLMEVLLCLIHLCV